MGKNYKLLKRTVEWMLTIIPITTPMQTLYPALTRLQNLSEMDTNNYNQIIEYLINYTFPQNWISEQRRQLRQQANHYIVQDNLLFKRNKDGSLL
ncbi:21428_t:CDS:2 [Dentiscutata erythropus]|uniref:21428_t:CDS:1 n=1 Tax=Dentiscutata erythropus TaxID=1348616 RepID=A0A9N9DH44_9GLOM|nr:21428_t:CDS:2 [Dentiscutata erythropus]